MKALYDVILLGCIALLCLAPACKQTKKEVTLEARAVEVREHNGKHQLYRNGSPYFIQGAGGYDHFDVLHNAGGNSIRIWGSENAQEVLDKAHKLGLTVTVGIQVAYAKSELDYNNKEAVAAQKKKIRNEILKYKDHPALLMWGIGNEPTLHLSPYDIMQHNNTWSAIDDIAKMIHELDPDHPTTTMLQDIAPQTVIYISKFCNDIDILSINIFRKVESRNISEELQRLTWDGPFILSEYGAIGYWAEEEYTDWYALYERSSTEKVQFIKEFYQQYIEADKDHCLGSYVFFWGQKHEYTATWLSLFTESGEQTEIIDGMHYLWTHKWPENRAPSINSLLINKSSQGENIYLRPGTTFNASIIAHDSEHDSLILNWEILADDTEMHFDATYNQRKPEVVESGTIKFLKPQSLSPDECNERCYKALNIELQSPAREGPYRLFMYVKDESNKVATANSALYVTE